MCMCLELTALDWITLRELQSSCKALIPLSAAPVFLEQAFRLLFFLYRYYINIHIKFVIIEISWKGVLKRYLRLLHGAITE